MLGFSDEMERKGRSVRTQILSQQLRDPTPQEISALGLTDDTQVVALKRLPLLIYPDGPKPEERPMHG